MDTNYEKDIENLYHRPYRVVMHLIPCYIVVICVQVMWSTQFDLSTTSTRQIPDHLSDFRKESGAKNILRPNYGTIFEDGGKMLVGGVASTMYRHTVAIPIDKKVFNSKKFTLVKMPCNTARLN